MILIATIAASSLAFIDGSVVNVALPSIGRSFAATPAGLQWTINAYLLPLSALLLLGGAAGDHFGRRALLIIGTVLFSIASVACAWAPTMGWLLGARAAQGVGAALVMPNSLAVLGDAFTGEARGRAIGTWASVGAIASAIGPPLGGWLVDGIGWRAIFLLNLPVAVIAVTLTVVSVQESGERSQRLDWLGATLATLALGTLTWALTVWSNHNEPILRILGGSVVGMALLLGFLLHEHRRGELAMMPLSLFTSKAFVGLTVTTFLLYGALGGLLVLLPYVLIGGGYSPLQAGLALLPLPIGIGAASRLMGRMTEKAGPRLPLTIGPIVTGLGFALLVRLDPAGRYWTTVFPGIAIIALGMAGAVAPLTTAVLASVDEHHIGTASGFNSAIARTGGLLAMACAGVVIAKAGVALLDAFHGAIIVFAALAVASGSTAFLTLRKGSISSGSDLPKPGADA
ncbi:MFS transporter [Lichenicola cladoniae]|uniref:MFS transporter n=1 Tax=Lichenicola cladoniae TaxID=1484109 RepID=UPI001EF4B412|nr:MFS transporter [Lichenicola cladoniae]